MPAVEDPGITAQWQAVGDFESNLTGPRIKLQTFRTVGGVFNSYGYRLVVI